MSLKVELSLIELKAFTAQTPCTKDTLSISAQQAQPSVIEQLVVTKV